MVQAEALCRVLHIRSGGCSGTTFTIERNGSQYLITAKHLFKHTGYPNKTSVELLLDNGYQKFMVDIRYHNIEAIDIAVMKSNPHNYFTAKYDNPFTSEKIVYGQDVYFLGFPLDYNINLMKFPNRKVPVPFIKKACLSNTLKYKDGSNWLLLDGHNNPGFSGGPVCFKANGEKTMSICGVVCSYRPEKKAVYDELENELPFYILENAGIIYACDISHAIEIIDNFN